MSLASHMLGRSRKFTNAPSLLLQEHALFIRRFVNDAHSSVVKGDDIFKSSQHGFLAAESNFGCSQTGFNNNYRAASIVGLLKHNAPTTGSKMGSPIAASIFNKGFSGPQVHPTREFPTSSGRPPHQGTRLPSLSSLVAEGDIAKWLKKKDEVSRPEVLSEVEAGGTFTNLGRPFSTKQFSFLNGQRKGTWAVMLGAKAASSGDVGYGTKGPRNILRPLSPHLTIYEPQRSSTSSISNRIAGIFLTAVVLSFYLVFMKMGPICLTYENFYRFLFYASSTKLMLITAEVSALALLYHIYQSVRHHLL